MKFNHWLPKLLSKLPYQRINAIVLFGTIYFREEEKNIDKRLYKHELKHVEQQKKEPIMFYLKYILYYLINMIKNIGFLFKEIIKTFTKYHLKSYKEIKYEIEAREEEKS